MILFRADAILGPSNSKEGKGVIPCFEHEDFGSSTELTISTSLIHSVASVGKFEQEHTSVLNLIFQHENVCGVVNLSKSSSEI